MAACRFKQGVVLAGCEIKSIDVLGEPMMCARATPNDDVNEDVVLARHDRKTGKVYIDQACHPLWCPEGAKLYWADKLFNPFILPRAHDDNMEEAAAIKLIKNVVGHMVQDIDKLDGVWERRGVFQVVVIYDHIIQWAKKPMKFIKDKQPLPPNPPTPQIVDKGKEKGNDITGVKRQYIS